jgi:hypothetical protein
MVTNVKKFADPVDPTDPKNHGIALWCIFGSNGWPCMICCKIIEQGGKCYVWGYSVWQGEPGFRTLGVEVTRWAKDNGAFFYDNQTGALQVICKLTQPKDLS